MTVEACSVECDSSHDEYGKGHEGVGISTGGQLGGRNRKGGEIVVSEKWGESMMNRNLFLRDFNTRRYT